MADLTTGAAVKVLANQITQAFDNRHCDHGRRRTGQAAAQFQTLQFIPWGVETIVPQLAKFFRQNVQQITADKLLRVQSHTFNLVPVGIVAPAESDFTVLQRQNPVVGNGDAVRVPSEIIENLLSAAKGRFAVDHPILAVAYIQKSAAERLPHL